MIRVRSKINSPVSQTNAMPKKGIAKRVSRRAAISKKIIEIGSDYRMCVRDKKRV
jgi:hypothetical protein